MHPDQSSMHVLRLRYRSAVNSFSVVIFCKSVSSLRQRVVRKRIFQVLAQPRAALQYMGCRRTPSTDCDVGVE